MSSRFFNTQIYLLAFQEALEVATVVTPQRAAPQRGPLRLLLTAKPPVAFPRPSLILVPKIITTFKIKTQKQVSVWDFFYYYFLKVVTLLLPTPRKLKLSRSSALPHLPSRGYRAGGSPQPLWGQRGSGLGSPGTLLGPCRG